MSQFRGEAAGEDAARSCRYYVRCTGVVRSKTRANPAFWE
jgi:hypothetical protein